MIFLPSSRINRIYLASGNYCLGEKRSVTGQLILVVFRSKNRLNQFSIKAIHPYGITIAPKFYHRIIIHRSNGNTLETGQKLSPSNTPISPL